MEPENIVRSAWRGDGRWKWIGGDGGCTGEEGDIYQRVMQDYSTTSQFSTLPILWEKGRHAN